MTEVQQVALEIMKSNNWFKFENNDVYYDRLCEATGMAQQFLDITSDPLILGEEN